MRRWAPAWMLLALVPREADAQVAEGRDEAVAVETDSGEVAADPAATWVAGLSGGLLQRDVGPDSPYSTLSLTRYKGATYLRGGVTFYRSTIQQPDTALPSNYWIGSLGAGGNWNDWVVDAFASLGRQDYGKIVTSAGRRTSEIARGAIYVAAGLRAGRTFHPGARWYVTPLLGVQYASTQSLRHRIILATGEPQDFQLAERALTANATLRIDHEIGKDRQHLIGVSAAHFESTNGLTAWNLATTSSNQPSADPIPDAWEEIGLSGTFRLTARIWADAQIQRTIGAVASDSTTLSAGLRYRF